MIYDAARNTFVVEDDDDWNEMWDEPEAPFEDGPLQGEFVRVDGYDYVAFYVQADDGIGNIRATMVGDDRNFNFEESEVHVIDREDFCGECGQMGCTHDGLERE